MVACLMPMSVHLGAGGCIRPGMYRAWERIPMVPIPDLPRTELGTRSWYPFHSGTTGTSLPAPSVRRFSGIPTALDALMAKVTFSICPYLAGGWLLNSPTCGCTWGRYDGSYVSPHFCSVCMAMTARLSPPHRPSHIPDLTSGTHTHTHMPWNIRLLITHT